MLGYDTKYCWRHITKPIPSIVAVVQKEDKFPIRLAFSMAINKLQGQNLTKSAFSFRNLYSVTGNYVSLSQEFDHWDHLVFYLRGTRLLIMFTMKYMNK
jgi:hypothetical protein